MSSIVIVDSSVLLNIMDVPGRNERNAEVLNRLETLIEDGDHLFIPMAVIGRILGCNPPSERSASSP